MLKIGFIGLLCVAVASCGFSLRGSSSIPASMQPIYLDTSDDIYGFKQAVQRQFAINDVTVTRLRKKAKLTLELNLLDSDRRSVSLDSNALDAEYALFESVRIQLLDAQGQLLKGPRVLTLSRTIVNDPDNPLGEETESELVRAELREQLSSRIARQLEYWSHRLNGEPDAAAH